MQEKTLYELQQEISDWSQANFGINESKQTGQQLDSLCPLLGVVEEVGELSHVVLKRHQGIRCYDDDVKYTQERNDALADIMIYLCDFAAREGVNLSQIINETWEKVVKKRNWVKCNQTGKAE